MKDVAAIFGLHVWPFIPSGTLASRAGPFMGACQQFQVRIIGVGGHAAMPHATVDPIVAAANTISALQVCYTCLPTQHEEVCFGTWLTDPGVISVSTSLYELIPQLRHPVTEIQENQF